MTSDSTSLQQRLEAIQLGALVAISGATDEVELEAARVRFLGRSGELSGAMASLGSAPPEERPLAGRLANEVKRALEAAMSDRLSQFAAESTGPGREADLTLPGRQDWRGGSHPVTQVIDEICEIFGELGFSRAAGPEIETEWYNFTALNIPLDHPAADMHDTFYLDEGVLLRTHTSPVQARVMQVMPIMFTGFFAFFPSGRVLYWVTNTVLSIAQQWKINRVVEKEAAAHKGGKKNKSKE